MYSYEIEKLLKEKKFLINYKEYLEICNTSPQIDHVLYNKESDDIDIWTNDNYHFKIRIKAYKMDELLKKLMHIKNYVIIKIGRII